MAGGGSFRETLRGGCAAVWASLLSHPFVEELAAGTLPLERFRFFLEQDLLYLERYARALELGAGRARDKRTRSYLRTVLAETLEREIPGARALLARAVELGAEDRAGAAGLAPAGLGYASWLVALAHEEGALELLTALAPCAWSYAEIGTSRADTIAEHPLYAVWLRLYAGAGYREVVEELLGELERLAAGVGPERQRRLVEVFRTGARFERAFWDAAYRLEGWPDEREPST